MVRIFINKVVNATVQCISFNFRSIDWFSRKWSNLAKIVQCELPVDNGKFSSSSDNGK